MSSNEANSGKQEKHKLVQRLKHFTHIHSNYAWCESLHEVNAKKVITTENLNLYHCKQQPISFACPMQVQCVLKLLSYTHQYDMRFRAKHSAIKTGQFLQLLFVFEPSRCSRLQDLAKPKPQLSQSHTGEVRGGSDLEIVKARNWTTLGRSIAQANAYSRILSPHCGCVVALRLVWQYLGHWPQLQHVTVD
jgi:hypothetical protein